MSIDTDPGFAPVQSCLLSNTDYVTITNKQKPSNLSRPQPLLTVLHKL